MILRIVLGRLLIGDDADALADVRDRITTAARSIRGLESLIIGARVVPEADRGDRPIQAVFVSVWQDAEHMLASTGIDEEGRFMGGRLALPFEIERADHYEVLGRTFAALPPESLALLRVLRVRAREHDEARLVATLRGQQPRLVELGLVATHLGRRFVERGEVETVMVSVWPGPGDPACRDRRPARGPVVRPGARRVGRSDRPGDVRRHRGRPAPAGAQRAAPARARRGHAHRRPDRGRGRDARPAGRGARRAARGGL